MTTESPRNAMSINSSQVECLTAFMEENQDPARGLLKTPDGKRNSHKQWDILKNALNERGPPVREVSDWKKVWADYKHKVKNKLRHNKNILKKTGGGPNKTKHLNPYEESVVRSAGLNAAVSGIAAAKSYGCREPAQRSLHLDDGTLEASMETQAEEENEVFLEEYIDECFDGELMEAEEQGGELGMKVGTGTKTSKRYNGKKETLELFRRYVEAKEESNETQKALLQVKQECLKIKKQMLELELNKFALTQTSSQTDVESDN